MADRLPILLSFYGLTNGEETLLFGQLTYTGISDLSFKDYSRRKTFRTLFRLYHTTPYASRELVIHFTDREVKCTTNSYGAFYQKFPGNFAGQQLKKVVLTDSMEVKMLPELYLNGVHSIESDSIIVSDIDDTLLHSFIYKKLRKLHTMMFTSLEDRKAVNHMQEVINTFTSNGAAPVYLSNSEQNLYPMIYRFLIHNRFPPGPLFLKQLRSIWHLVLNIKFPLKNTHKMSTLEELLKFFPSKKFIFIGDNTQHDLQVYLDVAAKYAANVTHIIIRKVVENGNDMKLIEVARKKFSGGGPTIYYEQDYTGHFKPITQSRT